MTLEEIRKEINKIDSVIIKMLKKRFDLTVSAGKMKKKMNMTKFDLERENEILSKVQTQGRQAGLKEDFVAGLFKIILKESKKRQE